MCQAEPGLRRFPARMKWWVCLSAMRPNMGSVVVDALPFILNRKSSPDLRDWNIVADVLSFVGRRYVPQEPMVPRR